MVLGREASAAVYIVRWQGWGCLGDSEEEKAEAVLIRSGFGL